MSVDTFENPVTSLFFFTLRGQHARLSVHGEPQRERPLSDRYARPGSASSMPPVAVLAAAAA
ncbi:hypothetical protein CVT25_010001 [Psilocybe cyanescens]|uniref:Uncharacterized protein n=1 Tax=Psilocybe cyanescens TaxID=93625 RepID=A0A409XGQ9_PSICY|nr:hypothetical protein CVT25_010001 [Psilocybe cyanescens]